jgi:transcriptional regulator with XRE-family HTH domain
MSILSERLRKLRLKHKLTQKQVADYLGISESGYGYYEQGRNEPSLKALKLLATKYNVSVAYLTGETDDPQPQLTAKDEQDIAKRMEKIKQDLAANGGLSFYGEPLSEEAKESLLEAMEYAVRTAQRINKKYIPKKYREEGDN